MHTSKTFSLVAWELMEKAGARVVRDARRRPVFYLGLGTSLGLHALVLGIAAGWTVAHTVSPKGNFSGAAAPMSLLEPEPEKTSDELEAFEPSDKEEEASSGGGGAVLPGSNLTAGPAFAPIAALPPAAEVSSLFSTLTGAFGGGGGGEGNGSGMGSGSGSGKTLGKTGKLFGRTLQTGNEGVVVLLDVSGSMAEASGKVRAMVEREFSDALVIELNGALFADKKTLERLRRERGPNDYYLTYYTSMLPKSVVPVVTDLLNSRSHPPESVYFLSDYKDFVDGSAVRDLSKLLSSKRVKFFAHTLDADPDGSIKSLCRATGGDVLKEAVE